MPATMVLLHGFAGTGRGWDPVVERLDAQRYTALAPDLRGHGAARDRRPITMDDCVRDVLGAAPDRFDLCGYSLGGRLALHVALAAPERVGRLVLVSTTAGIEDDAARAERRAADDHLAAQLERDGLGAFAERWLAGPLFADDPEPAQALARADIARNDAAALAAALRGVGTGAMVPVWNRLGELAMPATVLVGGRDAKFTQLGTRLVDHLPDAQLAVVAGAGHGLPRVAPAAVADLLTPAAGPAHAQIRTAAAGAAGDLAGIHRRASLVWEEYRDDLLRNADVFGVGADALGAGLVRVAVDAGGLPLGFSVVAPGRGDRWELDGLFVEPRVMRRGVGRALIDDAVVRARQAGCTRMDVVAAPAAGFYERLGFQDAGAEPTRFGTARRLVLAL